MGRWTGKRWSRALEHARGQSNKRAAVKNQYLLINFPTLLACKKPAEQCLYWQSSPPSLYLAFQTQGPNRDRCNQSGKLDEGQIGEKGTGIGSADRQPCWFMAEAAEWLPFFRSALSERGLWFMWWLYPHTPLIEATAVQASSSCEKLLKMAASPPAPSLSAFLYRFLSLFSCLCWRFVSNLTVHVYQMHAYVILCMQKVSAPGLSVILQWWSNISTAYTGQNRNWLYY